MCVLIVLFVKFGSFFFFLVRGVWDCLRISNMAPPLTTYTNIPQPFFTAVLPTYYSDHDLIYITIPTSKHCKGKNYVHF